MWCVLQDRQIKIEVLYQSKFPPQRHKICCSGSPSDQFVTFLLLIQPAGEEMSTSLFCYRSALLFLAHRVESSVSLWGDFSTAFGEGPEQGSAGTSWGSRTPSSPSRESFSEALPPFVTDGDGWLGRPRGTCKIMYDIQCYMI